MRKQHLDLGHRTCVTFETDVWKGVILHRVHLLQTEEDVSKNSAINDIMKKGLASLGICPFVKELKDSAVNENNKTKGE